VAILKAHLTINKRPQKRSLNNISYFFQYLHKQPRFCPFMLNLPWPQFLGQGHDEVKTLQQFETLMAIFISALQVWKWLSTEILNILHFI
jgi:hypothetical protein